LLVGKSSELDIEELGRGKKKRAEHVQVAVASGMRDQPPSFSGYQASCGSLIREVYGFWDRPIEDKKGIDRSVDLLEIASGSFLSPPV
jgi:hypothetical protein